MTSLLERLREALAPDYEVIGELASGGMGVVFLGRDPALARRVAIKIIRPDKATPRAAERFVQEARLLASVSHPGIVHIHRAGNSGGFAYYVMDFVETDTLAHRLAQGPMSMDDAVRLGAQLLDALGAVHALGIVHRDIKPSNLFVTPAGVMLVDFGLAKTPASGPGITSPRQPVGTLMYMAPEQLAGGEVTAATDLYAAGLVLYEALRGRPLALDERGDRASWEGIPRRLGAVLRRALAHDQDDRWASAADFRGALLKAAKKRSLRPALLGTLAVGAAALVVLRPWWRRVDTHDSPALRILPFTLSGGGPGEPSLGESLAAAVARRLGANPDFEVRGPGAPPRGGIEVVVAGHIESRGDSLVVLVQSRTGPGAVVSRAAGPRDSAMALADTLARGILTSLWNRDQGLEGLPLAALPRSAAGTAAFVTAERLYTEARWMDAHQAYGRALALDTTCVLCAWRITDVERWLGMPHDPARTRRYRAAIGSFPPAYRSLINASFSAPAARLDTLRAATERFRSFSLAWFQLGDELFHRGPLTGSARHDALLPLRQATLLRPDFAPAWEHLAWVAIAEGDSALARLGVERHRATSASADTLAFLLSKLFEVARAFRFGDSARAARATSPILADPLIAASPMLGVAPRMLMTFDVPDGAAWMGRQLAGLAARPDARASGLIAQTVAHLASGRPADAQATARRLADESGRPDDALFAAELHAAWILLADTTALARRAPATRSILVHFLSVEQPLDLRFRAAFMLGLLANATGRTDEARQAEAVLDGEAEPRPLLLLVAAAKEAAGNTANGYRSAIARSAPSLASDSAALSGDPFFRTALHLLRARWHAAVGDTEQALSELRWHENLDLVGYPSGRPQAAEVDWAFGTIGRWRRAALLAAAGRRGREACAVNQAVARLWAGGEAPWRAAADTARARWRATGCREAA